MASTFSVMPIAGITLADRNTIPAFGLGTPCTGNQNDTWVYVKASGAVPAATCTVDGSFNVTSTAGNYTAPYAFNSGEYGWVYKTTSPL